MSSDTPDRDNNSNIRSQSNDNENKYSNKNNLAGTFNKMKIVTDKEKAERLFSMSHSTSHHSMRNPYSSLDQLSPIKNRDTDINDNGIDDMKKNNINSTSNDNSNNINNNRKIEIEKIDKADITISQDQSDDALKLVIVCVGLPARGKSYITKKLQRYLNWMQYNTKIFNVGNTRRQLNVYVPSNYPIQGPTIDHSTPIPSPIPTPSVSVNTTMNDSSKDDDPLASHNANLFDHNNKENFQLREKWAKETLDHLLDFLLSDDGNVGIFDATNTTKARRKWIVETINKRTKGLVKILFLESICTDENLIEKNIHLKLSGPDYKKMNPEKALNDFRQRLANYEKVYETIDEFEESENEQYDIQYVKIINAGNKVISYNISGYLSSQCVFFLLNFNLTDRQIWLTANGESIFNVQNRLGGDSDLTKKGTSFAKALPKFISKKRQEFKLKQYNKEFINDTTTFKTSVNSKLKNFNIWTSTLKRTIETAHYFPRDEFSFKSFKILNDLGCGSYDSITEEDFRYLHSEEYMELLENKLSYRYPGLGGESYLDVISRLRPIIIELERLKDHVLIVSHRVIIRVLLCYFMNLSKEMLTELDVQHNYVYCVEPKPYGLDLNIWHFDEKTDMFIEVDVAEIMKRKRKRGSFVLNDVEKLRRLLLRNHMNQGFYDSDDILSIIDNDSLNGSDDLNSEMNSRESSSINISPKNLNLCERSDSQAYEFIKNSSNDLRSLGFNQLPNINSKLNKSESVTSMGSIGSIPSASNLQNLHNNSGVGLGVAANLKKHLKGSSSDLRGQAIQAKQAAQVANQLNHLNGDLTPGISLSRKNSLRHIKKPSIDWDLFDHSGIEISNNSNSHSLPSILPLSSGTIVNMNRTTSGLNLNVPHNRKTESVCSGASSGASSSETSNAAIDAEIELIMANPILVEKLKETLLKK